jgi:hypothetical protein
MRRNTSLVCAVWFGLFAFGSLPLAAQDEAAESESEMDVAAPPLVGAKSTGTTQGSSSRTKSPAARRWIEFSLFGYDWSRVRSTLTSPSGEFSEPATSHAAGFVRDDVLKVGLYGRSLYLLAGINPGGFRYDVTFGVHTSSFEIGAEIDWHWATSDVTDHRNGADVKTESSSSDWKLGLVAWLVSSSADSAAKFGLRAGILGSATEVDDTDTEDVTGFYAGFAGEYVVRLEALGRRISSVHGLSWTWQQSSDERGAGFAPTNGKSRTSSHQIALNVFGLRLGF